MRVGVTLFAQNYSDWDRYERGRDHDRSAWDEEPLIPDQQVYDEEIALGELVEPLGFDSLWTVEHHFDPYTMCTNTLQFLTFFAGRTKRIDFGTMVVVLPWHDPVRVAEEAVMLDNFLQGRKLHLGFGRGAAQVEFDGMRIDMNSSRERFLEALEVVRKAIGQKHFSHEGKYFQIPDIMIRPRPRTDLLDRMYMAWGSPTSVAVAADNGLKPLIIPQKDWQTHVSEMKEYNQLRMSRGYEPGQPVVLLAVYVDEDEKRATELGAHHVMQYADSVRRHYRFDEPSAFANVKGYEYYDETAKRWADEHAEEQAKRMQALIEAYQRRLKEGGDASAAAVNPFVLSHVWGTPDVVLDQIKDRVNGVGAEQFCAVLKFGDMSGEVAEKSMRLFAKEVLPELHKMPTPAPLVPDPVG